MAQIYLAVHPKSTDNEDSGGFRRRIQEECMSLRAIIAAGMRVANPTLEIDPITPYDYVRPFQNIGSTIV